MRRNYSPNIYAYLIPTWTHRVKITRIKGCYFESLPKCFLRLLNGSQMIFAIIMSTIDLMRKIFYLPQRYLTRYGWWDNLISSDIKKFSGLSSPLFFSSWLHLSMCSSSETKPICHWLSVSWKQLCGRLNFC